ncbi:S-adenosyl-L-methionine-dependent methyltransferase [Mycena sp. CBHHK59/15]|nr:S-adenosyl-L-methionine-dependent methyltransferase [Mycena sp. CBHHK59/15]
MSPADSPVSALVALIANAAKTLETEYNKSPEGVPSLDSTAPHSFDKQISSFEMIQAVQILEGACAQLCATLARPSHTAVNKTMGVFETTCLHVALSFKIPDILQEKPAGMHVSEISKKTGIEQVKLARILRLLATGHCFREVDMDVFANNRISIQLLSANPISSLGFHFIEENDQAGTKLVETLADPTWGPSYAPEHSAWNRFSGQPKSLFAYWDSQTPEARAGGERFGLAMLGWGNTVEASAIVSAYPWAHLGDGATVCDVGGGVGTMTMQFAKAHPKLQLKLQDMPDRMVQAKNTIWPAQCPEAIKENRIEFKAINFLTESPISGCDVYYLKNILHDWPDAECITILNGVRKVMKPGSRVLIHEYILQSGNRTSVSESKFTQAPEPMLPNYGVGKVRQYNLDLTMLLCYNAKERTLQELIKLGEASGLSFTKLWEFGELGAVEFRLPA